MRDRDLNGAFDTLQEILRIVHMGFIYFDRLTQRSAIVTSPVLLWVLKDPIQGTTMQQEKE